MRNNNQAKKHSWLIGLTNTVQETQSFTDTTMLEHFITSPPRGYEHVVDKKTIPRSKYQGLLKSEQIIFVRFTRLT